jgi:hypothetical protein
MCNQIASPISYNVRPRLALLFKFLYALTQKLYQIRENVDDDSGNGDKTKIAMVFVMIIIMMKSFSKRVSVSCLGL